MSQAAEFAHFCGNATSLQNVAKFVTGWLVIKGQIQHILVGSDGCRKLITTCRHYCAMKYMTSTQVLTGEILKILNLSEILPIYLGDRLYLEVAVTGNKYCIFGRVQGVAEN